MFLLQCDEERARADAARDARCAMFGMTPVIVELGELDELGGLDTGAAFAGDALQVARSCSSGVMMA